MHRGKKPVSEQARVIFCKKVAHDTFLLRLESPVIATKVHPGQMLLIRVDNREIPLLRRPFAAYRAEEKKGFVEILFEIAGKGTLLLSEKKTGEKVGIIGPLGMGFPFSPKKPVIALAGGMGLGPIRFVCDQAMLALHPVHLFYGARDKSHLYVKGIGFVKNRMIATDNGSFGKKGLITDILKNMAEQFPKESVLMACGPYPMMKAAWEIAQSQGWKCLVSLERHMACGVGACNGCVVDTLGSQGDIQRKRVCKDGPVFPAESIVWT